MDMQAAQKAMNKAKIQLMERPDSIFFTTVCFSLQFHWDETIPTACTNGKELRINPAFFLSLNPAEQVFLLLHETLHVAFMHMVRLSERNPAKWNMAADYVINALLIARGYTMPKGGLYEKQYRDMSTEAVYNLLPDPPEGFNMDLFEGEGNPEEIQTELDDLLVRAALQAEMQNAPPGSIPAEIQIYLDSLINPQLPWHRILRSYFTKMAKNDYTFRKPNRRFFPDMILPTPYSDNLTDIAIAVDTSGSVTDDQFCHFISEVQGIMKQLQPTTLTLIQFDTKIKSEEVLKTRADLGKVGFVGRGGTRIEPVFEWAKQHKPNVLIIFTDGYFHHPQEAPTVPIIWVIHSNPHYHTPYGKVITYQFKD